MLSPEFQWFLSDILDHRAGLETQNREILWSRLLRLFPINLGVANTWSQYLANYREALLNPDDAIVKAKQDIDVNALDFDAELLDALSEWIICTELGRLGFDSFQVIIPPLGATTPTTPDFLARYAGVSAAIEVKNLRAHDCVEAVMPAIFYDELYKGLSVSNLCLIVLRSSRKTLNSEQKQGLRNIVRRLPNLPMNEVFREKLSNGIDVAFKVISGNGTAMCQDYISADDLDCDVEAYAGLLNKIAANTRKALSQLYSPIANSAKLRVVAMRWDIPFVSIPWPQSLTEAVLSVFEEQQCNLGLKANLHIFSDSDYVLASTVE